MKRNSPEYNKWYYQNNREKRDTYSRAYRLKHPYKFKERKEKYNWKWWWDVTLGNEILETAEDTLL